MENKNMRICNYFNNTFTILHPMTIIIKNGLILELRIKLQYNWYGSKQITLPRTYILTADLPAQNKHILSFSWEYVEYEKWNGKYLSWGVLL